MAWKPRDIRAWSAERQGIFVDITGARRAAGPGATPGAGGFPSPADANGGSRPSRVRTRRSETELAVGTEAHKLEARVIRLAVDENEIGPDVAVAMIAPIAGQRVVDIPAW